METGGDSCAQCFLGWGGGGAGRNVVGVGLTVSAAIWEGGGGHLAPSKTGLWVSHCQIRAEIMPISLAKKSST